MTYCFLELTTLFFQFPTGAADPRRTKLCPIHRTFLFLSDGWESAEFHDDVMFC
jgi:hypothetical protein